MGNDILVITEHLDGEIADISYEMMGMAKELAAKMGGQAIAVVLGSGISEKANTFSSDETLYVDATELAHFNPEAYAKVIEALVTERSPGLTMIASSSMGMDLAAWLSAKTGQACVAYVTALTIEGDSLLATGQVYGGKIMAQAVPVGESVIASVVAGSGPAELGRGSTAADQIATSVALGDLKTKFVQLITPEEGDIDITTHDKLVAVGRGIGNEDNIELAQELADALGAAVSASRPLTDAGWLPKTRQVGKSGVTVKPKLYLMLGISGAPEHLEGMKDSELIIAINTDPNAPIFDVAHYGTTSDLFDVAEAMLEMLD